MKLFFKKFASLILGLVLTTQLAVAWSYSDLLSIFSCRKQKSNQQAPAQVSLVSKSQSQSNVTGDILPSGDQVTGKDAKASTKNASISSVSTGSSRISVATTKSNDAFEKEAKIAEKRTAGDEKQSPLVIILNGTSSAGKSSIAKQMLAMLGKNWEVISMDDYITDEFFKRYPQALQGDHNVEDSCLRIFQSSGVIDLLARGNALVAIADQIHCCCNKGINVIVDLVLSGKQYDFFINALKDCNFRHCLVYCPLLELMHRISVRNELAMRSGATFLEKMEKRDIARAVRRFGTFYTYGQTHIIDKLADVDRESVLSLVQKNYTDSSLSRDGKQSFEQFCTEFEKNMGNNRFGYAIQPVLPYNFIVNSGTHNSYQCACRIIDYISSQRDCVNKAVSVG